MLRRRLGGQDLLASHHVARHCRRRDIGINGAPLDTAFRLRSGERYLSTNWLEYFHDSERRSQIDGVLRALTDKGFRVSPTASFAVLNVGAAIAVCKDYLNLDVRVVASGEVHDPSHTGIYGYTAQETNAAAMLASLVNPDRVYPAIPNP